VQGNRLKLARDAGQTGVRLTIRPYSISLNPAIALAASEHRLSRSRISRGAAQEPVAELSLRRLFSLCLSALKKSFAGGISGRVSRPGAYAVRRRPVTASRTAP